MQFSQALNSRRVARSLVTILALTLVQTIAAPIIAPHLTTQKSEAVTVDYASATAGTDVVVPAGASSVTLTARGGAGGSGGNDGGALGTAGSRVGYVSGTFSVTPGDRITLYPGGAGGTGVSSLSSAAGGTAGSTSMSTANNTLTPAVKLNGTWNVLLNVNGGAGGAAGNGGSSGGGGGGGAASVIFINDNVALVAGGGGGGGGGSGAVATAWDETPAANGQLAIGATGNVGTCTGQTDGGGSGGGGGGWYGGSAGAVTRPTGGECRGYGGAAGSNFVDTTFSPTSTSNSLTTANGAGSVTYVFTFDSVTSCVAAQQQVDIYTVIRVNSTSPCTWSVPANVSVIDLFLVGGGGGGAGDSGPGGNGGAALSRTAVPVTPNSILNLKVGYGGAGSETAFTSNAYAGDSTTVVTSTGSVYYALGGATGGNGPNLAVGTVATPQNGAFAGGAGGTASTGANTVGGNGKTGVSNYFYGVQNTYAGGGGGGLYTNSTCANKAGATGANGGGAGASITNTNIVSTGFAGTNGTGGGGGGGVAVSACGLRYIGGKGGSGVILIRYATNSADAFPVSLVSAIQQRWLPGDIQILDASRQGFIDSSGNFASSRTINGTVTIDTATLGTGSTKSFLQLKGDTNAYFNLENLPSSKNYTLFSIAKYQTNSSGRIVTSSDETWISGFWQGHTGIAYHANWLSDAGYGRNDVWALSTDELNLYRFNGKTRTNRNDSAMSTGNTLGINNSRSEVSNWQLGEVLVFNRELNLSEIALVENYLSRVYGIALTANDSSQETDTAGSFAGSTFVWAKGSSRLNLSDTFTVEAWVKTTSTCDTGHICYFYAQENGLVLGVSSGILYYALYGASTAWEWTPTGVPIKSGEWHHVAMSKDLVGNRSGALKVYVDGNLVWTKQGSPYVLATTAPTVSDANTVYAANSVVYVGYRSGGDKYFYGNIDEVKVWSGFRTSSEIKSDMYAYGPIDNPKLKLYLDFNKSVSSSTSELINNSVLGEPAFSMLAFGTVAYEDVKQISTDGVYTRITFPRSYITAAGGWKVPTGITKVQTAVVGGGGGGGGGYQGGGGGAGGFLESVTTLTPGNTYSVRVGFGGNGHGNINPAVTSPGSAFTAMPTNGDSSTAFGLVAVGGGYGSSEYDSQTAVSWVNLNRLPSTGGSGGGGGWVNGNSTTGAQGIAGQGNAGGDGGACCSAAGGGGAGSIGFNGTTVKGGDGGSGKFSTVLQKNVAAGGGGSVRLDSTTATQGVGGSSIGGNSAYKPNVAVGLVGGASNGAYGTGSGGGAGLSLTGSSASYSGSGGSGVVALRYLTASVPTYTKPTNAYLNVGMTETFTTNVAFDSATVGGLTRTFKWESTTAGASGSFTLIKTGTGASNAAFSWIPSDTSTSGSNYLYRLTVTDSDTAGLSITDSSTAFATINPALVVSSTAASNNLAKKINISRSETFTITLGTPTYKATLSPVIPGISIDTSTAGSVILKIAETATVGTWLETLTVTDSVSANVFIPLTILVAAPPSLLNTGEIVSNGLILNLEAGNSKSVILADSATATSVVWKDLSGAGRDATTSGTYESSRTCTAPIYSSSNGGAFVLNGSSDCYHAPYVGSRLEKSFTAEAWFRLDGTVMNTTSAIITQDATGGPISFTLGDIGSLGKINAGFWDGNSGGWRWCGSAYSYTPVQGAWTYAAATYDGNNVILYINGSQFSSCAYTGGLNSTINTGGVWIGRRWDSVEYFNGSIASVRIYNRAITANEAQQNFNATKYRFKDAPATLLKPARKYGLVTLESFTATSGSETKTVSLAVGNLPGLTWDQTSIPGQLKVTASETFSVGTYYDTVTVTDNLGQSTYLPIKFTISKADTLTVSMSSATTNVYTGLSPASVPQPTITGLVGLDTATVLTRFDTGTVGSTCATGGTCRVGDTGPGGGVVFYVSDTPINAAPGVSDGGIYLEMYATTLNVNNWATDLTSVSGTQSAIGTGAENSRLAYTQLGANSALMNTIVNGTYGGKSDWFVPSLDEATTMVSVLRGLGLGSFGNQNLWTSTQGTDASTAQNVWSSNPPVVSALTKTGGYSVRPIRAFGGTTIAPVDVETYTAQGTNLNFSVGAASNYYNIVYQTSTLKITQANQSKLSLNLYGAVAGSPFTLIAAGGSGSGAISETITTGSSATNCQVSNHVLSNSNSATDQKFCRVTITKASSRNYKSESLTADVYFMVFVNDQPTNQAGGGTVIALSGKTSLTIETSTVSVGGSNFGAPLLAGYPAHYEMTCFGTPGGMFCTPEHWLITGQGFGSMYNTDIVVKFYRNAVAPLSNQTEVANSNGTLVNYVFSDTQIMIETFPVGARSGMIVVETPFGVAISDYDFEIP